MKPLAVDSTRPIALDTGILCVLALVAPQLFGGVFPWTVVVIGGLSLLALAVALWTRRAAPHPVIDGVFIAMVAAWLWTCVQTISLPSGIARALGLRSVQSAERLAGLQWAGEIPLTISYDPGSTQLHILIGVAILGAFLAARLGGPDGLRPIAVAAAASAALLGIEGLAHRLADSDAVFGVYAPRFSEPQLLTPLMNGNHLGGFATMGALVAASLAVERNARARQLWVAVSALCAVTVAWTLSRGAIGSLLFGFVLLGAWWMRGKAGTKRRAIIPGAVAAAAIVGALTFTALEPILRRFEDQGFDKLAVAARGFRLLDGSTWWLGVGRGAFSSTFVAEEGSLGRFTHPENIVVQWTTEWGVPIALFLLAVIVAAVWKRFRSTDSTLVAGSCVAMFALGIQNLVDFSLEMAGIAAVVAALLGALLPASEESGRTRTLRASGATLAVLVTMFIWAGPRAIESDTQSVVDRLTRAVHFDDEAEFQAELRRGLALHPGEPAFALLAGTYAASKAHADAPRWLSIVMDEAPGWGAPHAVAARFLAGRGQLDQALLEVREAEERHPGSARQVLCELIDRAPGIDEIDRAAPRGKLRVPFLNRATTCPGLSRELRAAIDGAILETDPAHGPAVLREARRLSSQQRDDEAQSLLEVALEHDPNDANVWAAFIRAQLSAGNVERAKASLDRAAATGLQSRPLTQSQARVEAALGRTDDMRATISRLRGQARGDARLIAASFMLEGELEASLGNVDEALAAYEAADVANPKAPALRRAADLALDSGRPSYAIRLYRTLCSRQPGGSACAAEARLAKEPKKPPPARPIP